MASYGIAVSIFFENKAPFYTAHEKVNPQLHKWLGTVNPLPLPAKRHSRDHGGLRSKSNGMAVVLHGQGTALPTKEIFVGDIWPFFVQ